MIFADFSVNSQPIVMSQALFSNDGATALPRKFHRKILCHLKFSPSTFTLLWATIVAQNKPSAACCSRRVNKIKN